MWIDRAQSAEAKLKTQKQSFELAIERVKAFKSNFGIKERDNGEITIDYVKFVDRLGKENSAELKRVIEEKYPT